MPLVLACLVPVILAGSMKLSTIVLAQSKAWFIFYPFLGQIAFLIFLVSALAEANRIPFDITESESELVAGDTVEDSGMKFAFLWLAEYIHFLAVSLVGL